MSTLDSFETLLESVTSGIEDTLDICKRKQKPLITYGFSTVSSMNGVFSVDISPLKLKEPPVSVQTTCLFAAAVPDKMRVFATLTNVTATQILGLTSELGGISGPITVYVTIGIQG